MCGRYALALRPWEIRAQLEQYDMPVDEAPNDDAVRQSYNVAPGYNELVYRADVPDWGTGGQHQQAVDAATAAKETKSHEKVAATATDTPTTATAEEGDHQETRYKLQAMKWGLIPFWTKRNPDYGSMLKTINCRDDSLIESRGMWNTMKQKKRCIVVCQGFYEWLKKNGGKEKIPHFTKRKDGKLMCLAGLWDCVTYEGSEDKLYTYTIITTSSNKQLNFLHDRMPVILENGSEEVRTWLDPNRFTWSKELQSLLRPYEGELEIYPVSKDVGKVGNNSPTFIIPVASKENKNNIANFFSKEKGKTKGEEAEEVVKKEEEEVKQKGVKVEKMEGEDRKTVDEKRKEDNAPVPVPKEEAKAAGVKREHDDENEEKAPLKKVQKTTAAASGRKQQQKPSSVGDEALSSSSTRKTRSATSNGTAPASTSPAKGSRKITSFFGK